MGPGGLRLAELVASLSLGIDLGFGQPMEHVLRQCLIALRLADRLDLAGEERAPVYYTALLVNVACHADAYEQAKWFGDDIEMKSRKYDHELGSPAAMLSMLRLVGSGGSPLHRLRVGAEFAISGHRDLDGMIDRHASLARQLATQLGLGDQIGRAVVAAYEQWDGKGWPGELRGEAIPIAARLAALSEFVEVAHRGAGVDAAADLARRRAGTQFDPAVATVFADDADAVLAELEDGHTFDSVIAAEPSLCVVLDDEQFDHAMVAVADFVDLKSPYTLGHGRAVSALGEAAARALGADADAAAAQRRAGLVHGFGRLGISNAIWDKPGPLGSGEVERVRMHPYLTERMLRQAPSLAPLGEVAVQLRERLDGSGYPRGIAGNAISEPARILAAADVYQALREPRPHRPAFSADDAASILRAEATAGRLDGECVSAVLAVAGHRTGQRVPRPSGLTEREVDVLRLLALGLSHRQIATRLVISPKTARNHIEHIYAKIGANNRVAASLFAIERGLLPAGALAPAAKDGAPAP
jgi:HD-GYP domain-containing protein (c-di-GMP phosphodiesterase class II)